MSVKKLLQELVDSSDVEINMTEKQINIVSAAIELFSEKGFAATSTSEIAKKAGVAEGTIYRHYNTKKDLLLAIPEFVSLLPTSREFLHDLNKTIDNPEISLENFLRAIILNRKSFASSNIVLIKVLLQEIAFHPELRDNLTKMIFTPARIKIISAIDRFKKNGEIVDLPSETIVNLIITSIFGMMFMRYIAQIDLKWNQEKETEQLIQYIMHGITNPMHS